MKSFLYNTILLLFLLTAFNSTAQDQKLYSFSLKATGQLLTYSGGAIELSDAMTGTNHIAQRFIIKRTPNTKILIATAAKPGLFLTRATAPLNGISAIQAIPMPHSRSREPTMY